MKYIFHVDQEVDAKGAPHDLYFHFDNALQPKHIDTYVVELLAKYPTEKITRYKADTIYTPTTHKMSTIEF